MSHLDGEVELQTRSLKMDVGFEIPLRVAVGHMDLEPAAYCIRCSLPTLPVSRLLAPEKLDYTHVVHLRFCKVDDLLDRLCLLHSFRLSRRSYG
jgi:hypothetical protein